METDFVRVASKGEIPAGKTLIVKINNNEVLLVNLAGNFYAISKKCTHMGGDLSKGKLEGNIVTCPRHKAKYDVTNGKVVSHPKMGLLHPKAKDLTTYQVKVDQDSIWIKH